MMDEKVVKILLQIGVDPQAARNAVAKFEQMSKNIKLLENNAQELQRAIAVSLQHGEDASKLEAELAGVRQAIAQVRRSADQEIGKGFTSAANQAVRDLDRIQKKAQETSLAGFNLRDIGEKVSYIGRSISGLGQGILAPLQGAASSYLQTAKEGEIIATRWKQANQDIASSYARIGGTVLQQLTPTIERVARLADKLADFVEANPWIVQAALGIGGGLVGVGKLVEVTGNLVIIAGTLQGLMKMGGLGSMAGLGGKMTAGAGGLSSALGGGALLSVLGVAGSGVAGVGAGFGINELMYRSGMRLGGLGGAGFGQYATVGAKSFGDVLGGIGTKTGLMTTGEAESKTLALVGVIGKLTGALDDSQVAAIAAQVSELKLADSRQKSDQAAGSILDTLGPQQQQALNMYIQYRQQERQALEQYETQRQSIISSYDQRALQLEENYRSQRNQLVSDFESQQAQAQMDFQRSRVRQVRDFTRQERQALEQYYRERAKMSRDHSIEVQRAEEDHQRRMMEMQQDHEDKIDDAAASRDALAIVNEQRDYEKQRAREETNYQEEVSRSDEDYAKQLADAAAAFEEQRQQRISNFQQQLLDQQADFEYQRSQQRRQFNQRMADMEEEHAQEQAKMAEQKAKDLEELQLQYDREKEAREKALADEYRLMEGYLEDMNGVMEDWYKVMVQNMQDFVDAIPRIGSLFLGPGADSGKSGKSKKGRASGGYADYGIYQLGEIGREFVANNQTTQALEQMLGGRKLSQESLISLASSGMLSDRRSRGFSLAQNFVFNGSLSESERLWFKQVAQETAQNAFQEMMKDAQVQF